MYQRHPKGIGYDKLNATGTFYIFSYNGEKHGLRKRINQKDYTRRLQEFFDHFLKGAPAPEWIEKGIPYLQREGGKEKYRVANEEKPQK